MRIRTQLILAAFLLLVVPLAAIVGYSYTSSRQALEKAYRAEADRLTKQMDRRLANIRADLDQRLTVVSALPISDNNSTDVGSIVTVMGDSASLVDALEFQPVRMPQPAEQPERPEKREVAEAPEAPEAPEAKERDEPAEAVETRVAEMPEAAMTGAAVPPPPPPPQHPIVIELPAIHVPRYVMSEEQRELIAEVTSLGMQLGKLDLPPEEREDLQKEMQKAQEELRRVVIDDRKRFQRSMQETQRLAREQQAAIQAARAANQGRGVIVAPVPQTSSVTQTPSVARTPSVTRTPSATKVVPTPVVASSVSSKKNEDAGGSAKAKKETQASVRARTAKDQVKAAATERTTSLLLGRKFETPVRSEGEVVGQLRAHISPEQVVRRVLGNASDDSGELAFAVDREGTIYTRNADERRQLDGLGVPDRVRKGKSLKGIEGWIVSMSVDPQSGLKIGVARPVGENLLELRKAAARNFGLGLGMIAFALIGMIPLSNHLTRDVKLVTDGAERIAHGDLMTRLPVKTKNELGQLATAFNRMAEDLSINQQKLLEQERAQKEQELQQRLLAVEYERKSVELEDARRFQLSMLPKHVPQHPSYDIAVFTRTATEVGGDYYDFHVSGDALTVTIGDATGHGAKAGTMVTVIKTLFAAYSEAVEPSTFLSDAAEKIKRMDLGRMAMALSVARFENAMLTLASAGMPPVLVHRASDQQIAEFGIAATPLGTLGVDYQQTSIDLADGDTVLFLSDGFPELINEAGQQLGYNGALEAFAEAARGISADAVISALAEQVRRWRGDSAPNDDVTFVVVRAKRIQ
ncbi:MAG TPA: SpoIIE family protein phosphatase [Thermoanaerobaculia bacterium]|nr:SpoIIE family protein phosphatase [Thermoanaerobaculia bacterium]